MTSTPGHNLSQGDEDSDAESDRNPAVTGTGCYKNYEHYALHRRSNASQVAIDYYNKPLDCICSI